MQPENYIKRLPAAKFMSSGIMKETHHESRGRRLRNLLEQILDTRSISNETKLDHVRVS